MSWTFSWLRSWEAVFSTENLEPWRAAINDPAVYSTPFMHPDVIRAWLTATDGEAAYAPFFMHARHASGQQVIWLFVRPRTKWQSAFQRVLHPVGCDLFDYHDPIVIAPCAPEAVLAANFWPAFEQEMRRHEGIWFDQCALSRIRPACFGDRDFHQTGGTSAMVRLDAYPDFAAYMEARRGSINKLDRKLRKFASSGVAEFCIYRPDESAAILEWLPALVTALQARYPEGAISPAFLHALATQGVASGAVYCTALKLDGTPFSWRIGFRQNDTYYDYVCGFDPEYGRLSPGLLHIHALIRSLYEEGRTSVYDFLLGAEGYKADWTDGVETTVRNTSIRSHALATKSRNAARRGLGLAKRTAPPVHRFPGVGGLLSEQRLLVPDGGPSRKQD